MGEFKCSKRELSLAYIDSGKDIAGIKQFLENHYQCSEVDVNDIMKEIQKSFLTQFNTRWSKASRNKENFLTNNAVWLNGNFSVNLPNLAAQPTTSTGKRGRPCVPYENLSESSKRRKNTELLNDIGLGHIYDAYTQGLRAIGEGDEAKIVDHLRSLSKDQKKIVLPKCIEEQRALISQLTDTEALSIFIDLDLTKAQYLYLRNCLTERNVSIFPPYYKLQEAKRQCYPPRSSMEITNISAKVNLQDLLDHTTSRLLMIDSVYKIGLNNLMLYSKWGCDGSSGQSEYKQVLPEESQLVSDANLFVSSLVPIKLIDQATGCIIWQNPAPSSVRFCRPISIEFSKETPDNTRAVVNDILSQINNLSPSLINKNGEGIEVRHELFLTMIDGKVSQVLTDTSSSAVCTVCGATPRQMNNLESVSARPENEDSFKYGLSTLHAWIRCMELILHLSYNLSFEKWSVTTEDNKRLKQEKKQNVQKRFREEMGLIIDKPRQVSGNSNDGNTARRFFYNASCTAEITGVDETLIKRLYIILQSLSSGIMIDSKKFGVYALETARLYVSKYNWYYMPSSVHKILIHGESIIQHFAVLPIGQLSEDAQESRNKDYKRFRLHHARKCSRSATNEDVFHTLLYTSDPYITSIRKPYIKNVKELDEDTLELLKVHQIIRDPEVVNI